MKRSHTSLLAAIALLLPALMVTIVTADDDENGIPDQYDYQGFLPVEYDVDLEAKSWDSPEDRTANMAPLKKAGQGMRIPFNYIVLLKVGYTAQMVDKVADRLLRACEVNDMECNIMARYYHVIKGFHMEVPERAVNETRTWSEVSYVEEDQIFQQEHVDDDALEELKKQVEDRQKVIQDRMEKIEATGEVIDQPGSVPYVVPDDIEEDDESTDMNFGERRWSEEDKKKMEEEAKEKWIDRLLDDPSRQRKVPWNLDRIDQRSLPTDDTYEPAGTGTGAYIYCAGPGVRFKHKDFGGRASNFFDALGGDGKDCQGYGTHTCSVAGGSTWGVAKNVTMLGLRIINCAGFGHTKHILQGFDAVAAAGPKGVISLPFLGAKSNITDLAVSNLYKLGYLSVVPAGNNQGNACYLSPARVSEAITVAGLRDDVIDERVIFSNHGKCVDLFAPAGKITGASHKSNKKSFTHSGTSLAVPHAAGVAAIIWGNEPELTVSQVRERLIEDSTKLEILYAEETPQRILYTSANPQPQPEQKPKEEEGSCDSESCDKE
ncbi:uncharacterized protein LOC144445245 [Glandiceps talaboti]